MSDNLLTTDLTATFVPVESSFGDSNEALVEAGFWNTGRASDIPETPVPIKSFSEASNDLSNDLWEESDSWADSWTSSRSSLVSVDLFEAVKTPTTNVLWRNASTGENQVWQIDGTQKVGTQTLPSRDTNWQIVGLSDFNRDGKDDLLWRNFKTGEVQIWAVNGASVETSSLITVNDFDWQIRGIGDFNRDGSVDLVWRNLSTGRNVIWFLKGTQYSDYTDFLAVADTSWNIAGVSDLDGDRNPDLVWSNAVSGLTVTWLMDGSTVRQHPLTELQNELGWKIESIQDFTGDQQPDILWHNERTGAVQYWENSQAQFKKRVTLPKQAPANSQLVSAADLDADGIPDLLWQDPATGLLTRWLMNRNTVRNSATLSGFSDPQWVAVGALQNAGTSSLQATLPTRRVAASTVDGLQAAQAVSPSFNRSDQVNPSNLSDYYRFDIGTSGVFSATLSGMTADADVRLVQDKNSNGAIDTDEILAWQWERGSTNESIRRFLGAGTYYVQVVSYNNQSTGYNLSTTFNASASDPDAFRINLNFVDSANGLSEAAKNAVREAARYWEGIITGRSRTTRSNELTITIAGQSFTNSNGTADTSTLALSGPSVGVDDADNLVVTRGTSTLNSRRFGDFNSNPNYLKLIMTHELVHVFGFGTIWEPVQFKEANGNVFTAGRNFVNTATSTYDANSHAGYAYGELLGTYTPTAIPIEPQIYAHWDETRFDTELLTPYAESQGVATPLSILTLAALQDLGWNVNYGAAQAYSLPGTSQAALQTAGSAPQSTSSGAKKSLAAKYTCGCSKCLSASQDNPLSVNLEDAIA